MLPQVRQKWPTLTFPIISLWTFYFFFFSKEKTLEISCELFAWQTIHMKCQDIFSMKNKNKLKCRLLQL